MTYDTPLHPAQQMPRTSPPTLSKIPPSRFHAISHCHVPGAAASTRGGQIFSIGARFWEYLLQKSGHAKFSTWPLRTEHRSSGRCRAFDDGIVGAALPLAFILCRYPDSLVLSQRQHCGLVLSKCLYRVQSPGMWRVTDAFCPLTAY